MNYLLLLILCISLLNNVVANAKVLIITHSYNRPDFIVWQYQTFKKFLKDDYDYVVFNDASSETISKEIEVVTSHLNVPCYRIPQKGKEYLIPAFRCASSISYSLKKVGLGHEGIIIIIDSDMFLVRNFSVVNYIKNNALCAVRQLRGTINYLWNGIVFLNMKQLPNKECINFDCVLLDGVGTDVGGAWYHYLLSNPTVKCQFINQYCFYGNSIACSQCQQEDKLNNDFSCIHQKAFPYTLKDLNLLNLDEKAKSFLLSYPDDIEFFCDGAFFHYRRGGNYHNKSQAYHAIKTQLVKNYMSSLLS